MMVCLSGVPSIQMKVVPSVNISSCSKTQQHIYTRLLSYSDHYQNSIVVGLLYNLWPHLVVVDHSGFSVTLEWLQICSIWSIISS